MKVNNAFRRIVDLPPIFIPLIIFFVLNVILNNSILSVNGINNFFVQITPTIFAVMAQTVVLLVREIDMSVGSVISLSTVVMATTMGQFGYLSILIVLGMAVVIGLINGFIVSYFKAPGIVVTLASSMIFAGVALVILPNPGGEIYTSFNRLLMKNYLVLPNSMIFIFITLFVWKYIKKSRAGQALYATGANYYSAYATGIQVKKTKMLAFVGSAVLSSFAAFMLCAKTMTGDALIGNSYTLTSISGAVLGGISFFGGVGSMTGAVAGGVVVVMLVNILFFLNVSSFFQYIVQGVILILAVLFSIIKSNLRMEQK
jgi:ribose transport system permease protein